MILLPALGMVAVSHAAQDAALPPIVATPHTQSAFYLTLATESGASTKASSTAGDLTLRF
jgi:hypothetical protein